MSSGKSSKENSSLQNTRQMLDELDALMERMLALPVSDETESDAGGGGAGGGAGGGDAAANLPVGKPHLPLPRGRDRRAKEGRGKDTLAKESRATDGDAPDDSVKDGNAPGINNKQGPSNQPGLWPTVSATLTVLESPESEQKAIAKRPPRKPAYSTEEHSAGGTVATPLRPFLPPLEAIPEDAIPPSVLSLPAPESMPPIKPLQWRRQRTLGNLGLLPLVLLNATFDRCTMLLGWPGRLLRSRGGKNLLGLAGMVLLAWAGLWLLKDWLGWTW